MRQFIDLIENASFTNQQMHQVCVAVGEHFKAQNQYFCDGDCLNFAVAMHEILAEMGVPSEVKLLMRSDGEDGEEDVLSHVVLQMNGETFDSQGRNAEKQWETDFNFTRQCNGEEQEWFWLEDLPESISQFLVTANNLHGDTDKLVDKPALREQIKSFVREFIGAR